MIFDRHIRNVFPSVAALSYNPVFAVLADAAAAMFAWLIPEWRQLPPNHLRVRVGVNNRIVRNQTHFINFGSNMWFRWLAHGYAAPDSVVLEIGCGCGRVAWPLRGNWFQGKYYGIDIDSEMLDWCRKNFDERFSFHQTAHASLTYHDRRAGESCYYELPCADESVDFIYATSLLTHLLEFEMMNYIRESFRVAKPGARVLMYFFSYQAVRKGGRWTFGHRVGNAYVENPALPEAAVAYDSAFIMAAFKSAGFEDVSVTELPVQSLVSCRR